MSVRHAHALVETSRRTDRSGRVYRGAGRIAFDSDERLLDARLNRESIDTIRQDRAAERAVASYYVGSLWRMTHGDLGISRTLQRPVRELLAERASVTLWLVAEGLLSAWVAALTLLLATRLSDSAALDLTGSLLGGALLCLPVGAVAFLLVMLNGPAFLAVALAVFPKVDRYLRGLARAAAQMPHVLAAKAYGASPARILFCHIVPVLRRELLALLGVSVALAVGAAIPVEALCGTPGLGHLAWLAALGRDLPVLTIVSVLVIACTVLANSGADLLADERSVPA
jgi:peptide/nickel transport system permease protein